MESNMKYLLAALLFATAITSCKKEEEDPITPPPPTNEEEVITTLVLTFVDAENSSNVFELRFSDPDGNGGGAPVITSDPLPADRAFVVSISVLNESADPDVNITAEIQAEDELHQFFFLVTDANLSMSYADADSNGQPVGLISSGVTGAASTGTLMVTLRHQPDKNGANVTAGDITNAGGETDITVTFPVTVQ